MDRYLEYQDTIRIVKTRVNGYGDELLEDDAEVAVIFEQNTGWSHGGNQTAVTSTTRAFVDPDNEFVQENFQRLEGMLVIASPFGEAFGDAWYRITDVTPARDTQFDNVIDNIALTLKKTTAIPGVS